LSAILAIRKGNAYRRLDLLSLELPSSLTLKKLCDGEPEELIIGSENNLSGVDIEDRERQLTLSLNNNQT